MVESISKRVELGILYGGVGLATVDTGANSGTTGDSAYVDATVTAGTWATGMWAGMEGARVTLYTGSTKVPNNANCVFYIKSVTVDTRVLRLTPVDSASAADIASKSAHTLYFAGAYGNEMYGLDYIISANTTVNGIDASAYPLWKGNVVTHTSGPLSMGRILAGIGKAVGKGLDEEVVCLVNPDTFTNLASDLAALRKFDSSYDGKKGENGFQELVYHGQNGLIRIVPHNCVKAADCFIFPPKRVKRIGAQDISFKTPGRDDEIFLHLANNAGYELRAYTDQALFIETPARCVKITGFVNS